MKWVYFAIQIGITTWVLSAIPSDPSARPGSYNYAAAFAGFIFSAIPTAMIYWTVEFFRWLWGRWTGTPYKVVPINDGAPVGLAALYGPEAKRLNPPISKIDYQSSERIDPPRIRDERL